MGGMLGLLPLLMRSKFGWVGILLVIGYVVLSNTGILGGGSAPSDRAAETQTTSAPAQDRAAKFVGFVLDDNQRVWAEELAERKIQYPRAKLVLFTDATRTGCGFGEAATGPFYCPSDQRVYIDLAFYDELSRRFGAKGDFAQAYVIAHEIGHHVQNVLGTSDKVHRASPSQQKGDEGLSVRLELQADCFAGVWAKATAQRQLLEAGDVEEALGAAAAIGDDRMQKQATGRVSPESWTHGSSAQRARWLKKGMEAGEPEACDTFGATTL